jgi:hypothetical protein
VQTYLKASHEKGAGIMSWLLRRVNHAVKHMAGSQQGKTRVPVRL